MKAGPVTVTCPACASVLEIPIELTTGKRKGKALTYDLHADSTAVDAHLAAHKAEFDGMQVNAIHRALLKLKRQRGTDLGLS